MPLITVFTLLSEAVSALNWLRFVLILAWVPLAIRYMRKNRNRPVRFDAASIPEALLPDIRA